MRNIYILENMNFCLTKKYYNNFIPLVGLTVNRMIDF